LSTASIYIESRQTEWRSITLAALVHIALLAFLWVGVQWQNTESTAVEAEIWDVTTREAAPPAAAPIPPEPVITPEKISVPVVDEQAVRQAEAEAAAKVEAEIILAQEKKKNLAKKKEQEKLKAEREEKQRQLDLAEQKKKEEKAAYKKAAEKAAEELEKKKITDQKKLSAKEQLTKDKLFEENMRRLTGQASAVGNGSINSTGDAAKSTGNNRGDPSYAARIAAKVRANTVSTVSDNTSNNPTVEYRIELLPDGSLRGAIRKLKSSGILRFDEEVESGIRNAAPFPKDKSGSVPGSIDLVYKMKE
jgi:colicin import membrane protein